MDKQRKITDVHTTAQATTRLLRKRKCDTVSSNSSSEDSRLHSRSKYFSRKYDDQRRLGHDFYNQPCVTLAKDLLGKTLVSVLESGERLSATIVETEAYCGKEDAACHSYKGRRSQRNKGMYMEPGTTYVYLIYGMYYCLNISSEGDGTAVLIRALEPVEGLAKMQVNRQKRRKTLNTKLFKPHQLCNGPGKLADSLCITKSHDQIDLVTCPFMWIENVERTDEEKASREGSEDIGVEDPMVTDGETKKEGSDRDKKKIICCPRIGIDSVEEIWRLKPLRFYILGNKCVSVRNKEAENDTQLA